MDTSVIDLPAPVAARLRRPGWRDPRLLAGIAMVAASVLLGSWVVRTAQATVPVYVSRVALVPGDRLEASQLVVVDVRLGTVNLDHYLRADEALTDAVVVRVVGRGELVPASAVGDASDLDLRPVSVTLEHVPSKDVTVGAQADLWFTPTPASGQNEGPAEPRQLARDLVVSEVTTPDSAFSVGGGTQVQVLVPSAQLPDILAALSADGTLDVVPVPGTGG
ncbi:hypothetical protein [Cellulomonas sp. URHE0023]|uniref:hypothetical protein n=1 Tax=Cellulomonas sp. URHE0023 TaxID=1380354 RepID=UPI000488744C|nr:hypothetical protein [Cellulomonas sp. URHE0023]